MRIFIAFIFFQTILLTGYAQDVDSLVIRMRTETSQEALFDIYSGLGNHFLLVRLDSSLHYFEKALELAEKSGSDSLISVGYNSMGRIYIYAGLFDKALEYLYKALALESNDEITKLRLLHNIATVYYRTGNLPKALDLYAEVEGIIKANRENIDVQKFHYYYGSLLNNVGAIFENQLRFDTALQVYTRGLAQSKAAKDSVGLGNLYTNIGKLYQILKKYNLAKPNFEEAFQVRQLTSDQYGMARSYAHLGGLFRDMNRYEEAIQYLEKSVEMATQIGSLEVDESSTKMLADIYAQKGYYDKAFRMLSKSIVLTDSLNREADSKKMAQVEMQYEFDKKQREAEIAQQEREFWLATIITGLVVFVLVAVLLFIVQRTRANNEQLQKEHFSLANKNLLLEKKVLEESLEYKNKELTTNVMYLMKKNELLNDVSQRLLEIRKSSKAEEKEKIYKIIVELNSATNDDVWQDFELRFNEVYNDFYERLLGQYPHLTPNDRKLCAFLRLNLSSKEICAITRQSPNSLNVSRARLRKKLGIDNSDTALISFLEQI